MIGVGWMCGSGPCMVWGSWCGWCGWSGMCVGWGHGVWGLWVEEWGGRIDVDRVGGDDCVSRCRGWCGMGEDSVRCGVVGVEWLLVVWEVG